MHIDRRTLMTGALAAGLAPALPRAQTGAPVARRTLGDAEIVALTDGTVGLELSTFQPDPGVNLQRLLAAEGVRALPPTPVNVFVVRLGGRTVLLDAGAGAAPQFGPTLGRLLTGLDAAGIAPADVDAVILTHAHTDHVEGLIDIGGAALFPNAEVILTGVEYDFWHDDAAMAAFPEGARFLFESARKSLVPYGGRVRPVNGETEVLPGLTLIPSPGHTPGHAVVQIDSGGQTALMLGDTLHNIVIHTARPDTGFAFDVNTRQAAASRWRMFDRAATDGLLVFATHVAFPSFGRISRDGQGFDYDLTF